MEGGRKFSVREVLRMAFLQRLSVILVLLVPALAQAAVLENPGSGLSYSGIGVVSGWKCEANGPLTVRFDGGPPLTLAYENERSDVRDVGACPSAQVGFVSIMNWANLGDGTHTAVVYDNGVEFARSTFEVQTLGEAFVAGVSGECTVADFPRSGLSTDFEWNQRTQHMEVVGLKGRGEGASPDLGRGLCCRYVVPWCDLDETLWVYEVQVGHEGDPPGTDFFAHPYHYGCSMPNLGERVRLLAWWEHQFEDEFAPFSGVKIRDARTKCIQALGPGGYGAPSHSLDDGELGLVSWGYCVDVRMRYVIGGGRREYLFNISDIVPNCSVGARSGCYEEAPPFDGF